MGANKDLQYRRLRRLNELIFDEEQIVTSLSIAKELKISPIDAQNLLITYVDDVRKQKSNDFHVTYLLCGLLRDGKGSAVYLVKEDDLKDKKCLFDNISTETIYSIQKGKVIDFSLIASVNSILEEGASVLVSKNCVKRDIRARKQVLETATTSAQQNMVHKNSDPSTSIKYEKSEPESVKSHTQSSQKHSKPKQNGSIASFFAKAPVKTESTSNSSGDVRAHIKTQNTPNSSGNVTVPVKTQTTPNLSDVKNELFVKENIDEGVEQNTVKDEQIIQKEVANGKKIKGDDKDSKDQKSRTLKQNNDQSSKKRKKSSKNSGPNKKRKRIQEICDSDSSDMFDDAENEDIIEMSDDEPVPVPAANPIPVPKNKKRKAVDKTYVDDEGFIVTSTEYVYESASEDEEKESPKSKTEEKIVPPNKNEKMKVETKLPGNKGKSNKKQISGKQPTLMSFFKKS